MHYLDDLNFQKQKTEVYISRTLDNVAQATIHRQFSAEVMVVNRSNIEF